MKTALITGATSGIGYELSKIFAKNEYDLVIISRSINELEKVREELVNKYGIQVTPIAKDLSFNTSADEIFAELKAKKIQVEILINNAGFGVYGEFCNSNIDDQMKMLNVNIISLTKLTKLFIDSMSDIKNGKILNVASTAGFLPGPNFATYYASKAYVLSFSQALNEELSPRGITVTTLAPGATSTKFQEASNMPKTLLFSRSTMSSEEVAEIGYEGLMQNKRLVVAGATNSLTTFLLRFIPVELAMKISKYLTNPQK